MSTDSARWRAEMDGLRAKVHAERRVALLKALGTPEGRRLWLWVRDEACALNEAAPSDPVDRDRFEGRRDVGAALDAAIEAFPDLRVALAKDRAALEGDRAAIDALKHRLMDAAKDKETSHAG